MLRVAMRGATVKDNEVLIKVDATAVNRTGCACRTARPFGFFTRMTRPRATVLGDELAGVVFDGKSSFSHCKRLLKPGGIYLS
jgi:NADPH:quinone reductase-like Zn-dependent oxidoreductase